MWLSTCARFSKQTTPSRWRNICYAVLQSLGGKSACHVTASFWTCYVIMHRHKNTGTSSGQGSFTHSSLSVKWQAVFFEKERERDWWKITVYNVSANRTQTCVIDYISMYQHIDERYIEVIGKSLLYNTFQVVLLYKKQCILGVMGTPLARCVASHHPSVQ